MPKNEYNTLVDLPEGLRRQFEKVEQRLWRVETTTAVCGVAASLFLSLLAVFLSDRLWETPVWLRIVIFLCGLGGAAAAAAAWARHWVWHRRDVRALATLVQRKYRRLGDRLLGIVELAEEHAPMPNFSPALYRAAIAQVAEEAQKFDFRQSVNVRPARNTGWAAGGLTVVLLAASLALPQASWNAFLRWIKPNASLERYTLVVLEGFEPELIVPHGEPFEISGTIRYRSFWKPSRVFGWFGREPKMEAAVQPGKADQVRLKIPGQVEKGVLNVQVGDALAQVKILPNHRPSLQQLSASVHLPDYLRYPDLTETVQGGSFGAVEGSRVSFVGTISRALKEASMYDGGHALAALKVQGPTFSSQTDEPAGAGELVFNWRDHLGLTNATPWRLALESVSDQPPQPELPDLPRTSAMLVSDVMHIHAEAQDDFGVRDLGLMWDVVSDAEQKEPMATEIKAEMASARQKKAEEDFLWSPAAFRIPADSSVELLGFARDYFPKRERARTASYVIRVLSPESHAEMLRQTLEALMAQIEDVTRLQEKIVADTQEVKEASTNLAGPLQAARLAESREEQLQNAQHLEDLSHQGQDTLREAMKNNLIPETTIRQWGQTLQQWQKLSEEKMQEAARAMNTAAQDAKSRPQSTNSPSKNQASESKPSENAQPQPPQNSQTPPQNSQSPPQNSQSPPSESAQTPPQDAKTQEEDAKRREQELAEAEKRAKEVLEALRKMEQKANENLDQLQALTLAQRLRKVGGNERELGAQLITNLADTIGLPPQELPDKFKKLNTAFVKQQGGAHDESDVLQGEISRFFERTQKPNYGKVSQDMKAAHTSEELDRMGTMIQSNITIQTSLDLTNWSGRFEKWADDLQPKEQGGGQSGSGQGQPPLDLTKQLIALLRLREKESNLRDQTGVLEWSKLLTPDYKEQAGSLAATQGNLGEALELIHQAVSIPQLDPPFDQVARSMKQSQELLAKPQTDAVTDGAEARSIDLISDLVNLINEQAQRGQQQQQQQQDQASGMSAEEMAFLTQVMRSGNQTGPPGAQPPPPGGRGGGNFSGGTTERTGHGASGDVAGRGEAGRIVNKAGSVIQNAPVEFRDALENYFHNVEKPGTPRP